MTFPKIDPTSTSAWKKLEAHFQSMKDRNMNDDFAENPERAKKFSLTYNSFFVDYSKNRIDQKTIDLLLELAKECDLKKAISLQFNGKEINETEKRPVLHTALRCEKKSDEVNRTLQKMKEFTDEVIDGNWLGASGKKITDVVNIGIGGSDLGPKMATQALKYYRNHLNLQYISNIDADQTAETLSFLNPETTLIIVVSKSFSTLETLNNAEIFKKWFLNSLDEKDMRQHFVAVTSNIEKATNFGIEKQNIFPMWDWVGGRFSLCSAVGLSLCCAIGFDNFESFLIGARKMDKHFRNEEFDKNIPVILGLLSIWYNNFFKVETEAIIPYSSYLDQLVPYLQQAVMESNGKNISRNGKKIDYQTGNIIWGSIGSNAQHAFFQLLHQGTKLIPTEFIGFKKSLHGDMESHNKLMANFFAQTEALLKGKTWEEAKLECKNSEADQTLIYKIFEGNKPSTTILIDKLTPENLGSLIAMYEHKILVQGVIWNIFSYDQWGVELGKQLASRISKDLTGKSLSTDYDPSTKTLLSKYLSEL